MVPGPPGRQSGHIPIPDFVRAWAGFGFVEDPPNAALTLLHAGDRQDTVVMERGRPHFKKKKNRVRYSAQLLDEATGNLSHLNSDLDPRVNRRFRAPSLFIDDATARVVNGCVIQPNTTCRKANLSGANLSGANMRTSDLADAILRNANMSTALLRYTQFYGADLSQANLSGAELIGASFFRAKLISANLSGANLTYAYLRGVDLSGANLEGADLRNAEVDQDALSTAGRLCNTKLYPPCDRGRSRAGPPVCGPPINRDC